MQLLRTLCAGPKELPGLARGAGQLTGRAAAYLSRSRAAFMKFSDENEITEVRCALPGTSQHVNLILVSPWKCLKQPLPLAAAQGDAAEPGAAPSDTVRAAQRNECP